MTEEMQDEKKDCMTENISLLFSRRGGILQSMNDTQHITYSDAIIAAIRNDPGLSRTDAIYQTIPDYLTWSWSHRVGAVDAEPVGGGDPPEGTYLEDHDLDRDATPQWAQDEYDALDETEQEEIRERAESAELERK